MRVLRQAVTEAWRRWWIAFGSALILALVAIVVIHGALNELLVFVVLLLLALLWFVLVIPARIESDFRVKEETLRLMARRQNVGNEIRNLMVKSRMRARQAREGIIESETTKIPVEPDPIHQEALIFARAAADQLERLSKETGQMPYESNIREIQGAVSSEPSETADDAIRQLEALAAVLERQLVGPDYR